MEMLRVQAAHVPVFTWRDLLSTCKEHATSPLVKRVITSHWQELLLIGGMILAVVSAAAAFFYGSPLLAISFIALGALNGTASFYMHQFSALKDLEKTAETLKNETQRLSSIASTFERENRTLAQTNQSLLQTNERLKHITLRLNRTNRQLFQTNLDLKGTNAAFQRTNAQLQDTNASLSHQVTLLTTQVSQLQESATRIRDEVKLFAQGNLQFDNHLRHLNASIRVLDDQISSSRHLSELITNRLDGQTQGLGEQIQALRQYFRELSDQNAITQRIKQFTILQTQIHQATQELNQMHTQYAEERARLLEIQNILLRLREAFEVVLRDINIANIDHRTQNHQLRQNVDRLSELIDRIPVLAN